MLKLVSAMDEYDDIYRLLKINTVHRLNKRLREGKEKELILFSEALHEKKIAEIANKIKELMRSVICNDYTKCTGYAYYMEGYDLIIKTGSAQVSSATGYDTGEVIKGIAGMWPKDNPEIIFYLASKKPNDGNDGRVKPMTSVVKEIVTNISSYYEIYDKKNESANKLINDKKLKING